MTPPASDHTQRPISPAQPATSLNSEQRHLQYASTGRRVVAIVIDWSIAQLIAYAFLGYHWGIAGGAAFRPLLVFAVMQILLVSTLGTSVGHRLCGIAVRRVRGGIPGVIPGLIRTALLCLVIPAVVWDQDGRGLHDKAAGTVIVPMRSAGAEVSKT